MTQQTCRICGVQPANTRRFVVQVELRTVQRYMRYCRALRERHASAQAAVLRGMGIEAKDIRVQVPMARMLKPSYAIVCDRQLKTVVLAVRGTHSLKVSCLMGCCLRLLTSIHKHRLHGKKNDKVVSCRTCSRV